MPSIHEFMLHLQRWGGFLKAVQARFEELLWNETLGATDANLMGVIGNILVYMHDEIPIEGDVMRADWRESAEPWTTVDRDRAVAAVAKAHAKFRTLVLTKLKGAIPESTRPPLTAAARAIAEIVWECGPLTAKQIRAELPAGHSMSEDNVRRIFSEILKPHYGFWNVRDGDGYRSPEQKCW